MLWQKEVLNITVTAGSGAGVTGKMRGRIEQLIIMPLDASSAIVANSSWDCAVTDKDRDKVDSYDTFTGRLDSRVSLPVGADSSEKLLFTFANITNSPATMKVICKILEN